jgi:hypothetical protein
MSFAALARAGTRLPPATGAFCFFGLGVVKRFLLRTFATGNRRRILDIVESRIIYIWD